MNEGIVVLSLFDGMSCGMIALERAGIKVKAYYASEIDKNAIKVSMDNYPNIIRIGDVNKVSYKKGVLQTEHGEFDIGVVDLLIGGSPCQDFSSLKVMGNNNYCEDGLVGNKSKLFYEYLRIKNESQPLNYLLENVKMSKANKAALDEYLGEEGILVDSKLLSFQKRSRIYWSSIKFPIPNDKNISFQDFKDTDEEYCSSFAVNKTPSRIMWWNNGNGANKPKSCPNVTFSDKVFCLQTKQDRSPNSGLVAYKDFCRYLTRNELEQAQTVPKDYTKCLSYNQACAVLGNGWTVDVIAHILSYMNE